MFIKRTVFSLIALAIGFALVAGDASAGRRVRVFGSTPTKEETAKAKKEKTGEEKPFDEVIKDKVVIEGLFTFYKDTTDNSLLMAIKPDQFGPLFLCGITRSQAEGAFFDASAMGDGFPFYFKRVGKQVMVLEKNLRFRADSSTTFSGVVRAGVSDHLLASGKIASQPQDSTGIVLVKADDFFITDVENVGYYLGQQGKTGLSFDRGNCYFERVKSFPQNSELDVRIHYKTNKPIYSETMQNPYSLFHLYHYSLSALPKTDYVPRIGDDRIGHFMTIYEDYTNLDTETPYVRYINRWELKKKDPSAALSEPVEPIVFWIENTTPEEYREDVKEGIEFWNPAFEKIGIKNAVVAKQMPDTADWDPADARYNVVRWMLVPGEAYAVGPSRANPFTGQIYDADVRFSSDWIRYMYNQVDGYIEPVSFDGSRLNQDSSRRLFPTNPARTVGDDFGAESAQAAAFGAAYLTGVYDDLQGKDSVMKTYVHTYLREIIAHEVGHTLGFRHNFKASTVYTLDQVNDPTWTATHSTTGTIMDYMPPNIAGPDKTQGDFFAPCPGPYDDWLVEYAYSDFGAKTPEEELPYLKKIASKAGDPYLAYGTDEDALGWSSESVDPYCNMHDEGSDPLGYALHCVALSRELWQNGVKRFDKPGNRYEDIYRSFQWGWRAYNELALIASKYVGGISRANHHIGDANGKLPFEVLPASEQRRAVQALKDYLFAPEAFDLPADLLNRLLPERLPDFDWSAGNTPVDFPLHQRVLGYQMIALNRIYSPDVIGRLLNNEQRVPKGQESYTMYDMFTDMRRAIWSEMTKPENTNSFRRQLQLAHLSVIGNIYLSDPSRYPADARTLAANDLTTIAEGAKRAVAAAGLDEMSRAHYREVLRQIEATQSASREYGRAISAQE